MSFIKILTEEQLKKMSTPRLVNIHRKLTSRLGFISFYASPDQCFPESEVAWATKEMGELKPFADILYRILATREHVERKERRRVKSS